WEASDVAGARRLLDGCRQDFRHWEHRYLQTLFDHLGQRTFEGHNHAALSVAFSPDGRRLASGSADGSIKVWDAQTGQAILSFPGHAVLVVSVAFSPDGRRLASASQDGSVKVWDAQTGQEILSKKANGNGSSVAFSPDGKLLAWGVGSAISILDAQTGQ